MECLETYVKQRLERELSAVFAYHDWRHTLDVRAAVLELGRAEQIDAAELRVLEAAALLHDIGYVAGCGAGHEERGAELAAQLLPRLGWSAADAALTARLIRATRQPCAPHDLLEQIICDADIEYLGRPECDAISERLRRELAATGWSFTEEGWLTFELGFLTRIQFYTPSCRRLRGAGLARLIERLNQKLHKLRGQAES